MASRTRLINEKAIVVYCDADNSIEGYPTPPDLIVVRLTQADLAKYERAVAALEEIGADKCTYWYDGDYELYLIKDEVTKDTKGSVYLCVTSCEGYYLLEPFENEDLRINSSVVSVYKDGDLQIRLDIKHSSEEIWADIGKVEELKEQLNSDEQTTNI